MFVPSETWFRPETRFHPETRFFYGTFSKTVIKTCHGNTARNISRVKAYSTSTP